ncbi:MAG TPA: choloylglycine hydrolase family protein [Spirochaetota bacterium]|nr:choloylglycine hydrolase family protein [Spirochaetota bacterium]HPL17279.1 choloylglycine hydrolase family protein [Spirochaetota bacterium]HQF06928.1 choloylglycine hydrolase family protein [Spirochaetota bacterium]HQH95453.1 choloylglycine hydrolase family protein [Spirochaetota bacterium]HQJ72611.1 choloylglycine hydrolase family protein [Spirochaetota bacterium]
MKKIVVTLLAVCFAFRSAVYPCTFFVLKAADNSVVNGRSMEYPVDLKSEIIIVPAGVSVENNAVNGARGMVFTTRYGFLGINAFGMKDVFVDGFNEKGLSLSGLMYTGAEYQQPVPGKFINLDNFATWVLGSFATVDEVKTAMSAVCISPSSVKKIKDMGLHVAISDISGRSIVIEFINGNVGVYDNPLGVMTNRPSFDWQMTNLRNYIHLDRNDRKPRKLSGVKIEPTGVGSGMVGLPGDWTPPSRFVRIAFAKDAALVPGNAEGAVNLSEHLLNIVDIPKGVIKEHPMPFITVYGYAQWVVIKDMTNRVLYFKTYENTAWKTVDLKKFDLQSGQPRKAMPINSVRMSALYASGMFK